MKSGNQIGVFISYNQEDRFIAETLAQRLREVGYQPWVDFAGIMGGHEWRQSIEDALKQSAAFLVLLTPESVASEWVHYEIKRARDHGCPIIPLLMRKCQIPDDLEVLQYVDFRRGIDHAFKDLQRALLSAVVRSNSVDDDQTEPSLAISDLQLKAHTPNGDIKLPLALVVEDSTSSYELLRDLLAEMNMEVHIAKSRNEATALIQANHYDFITLDMQLGADDVRGQEGVYLLDLLKRYQSDVPVVMITALDYDKNQTADFFETWGIKGMLDKPFDRQKLRALVSTHVKRARK